MFPHKEPWMSLKITVVVGGHYMIRHIQYTSHVMHGYMTNTRPLYVLTLTLTSSIHSNHVCQNQTVTMNTL